MPKKAPPWRTRSTTTRWLLLFVPIAIGLEVPAAGRYFLIFVTSTPAILPRWRMDGLGPPAAEPAPPDPKMGRRQTYRSTSSGWAVTHMRYTAGYPHEFSGLARQPASRDAAAQAGGNDQGAVGLRAGPSAAATANLASRASRHPRSHDSITTSTMSALPNMDRAAIALGDNLPK
jgi:hypothetical protein